jgi:hypothetical protein
MKVSGTSAALERAQGTARKRHIAFPDPIAILCTFGKEDEPSTFR